MVELEQVVDGLRATVHAQVVADRAQEPAADGGAVGRTDLPGVAAVEQPGEPVGVLREPPVVALVELPHRGVRRRVHVVRRPADRRQPPVK